MCKMIKNLQELLAPHIGKNKKIKNVNYKRLTKPGDNYGSIMLKVDVILSNADDEEENLHLVAKVLPDTKLFLEIFQVQMSYPKEMAVYNTMIPTVIEFQKELGIKSFEHIFAKCYGTRKNLNDTDLIDENAVLLFENLFTQGYRNLDRSVGFDLDTTRFILKDLATFHGSFIALKLKKPDLFNEKIKANCVYGELCGVEFTNVLRKYFLEIIKGRESCEKLLHKVKFWGETEKNHYNREPFLTVTHCDMWVNNTMQKFENDKVISNKFVDFQCIYYGSLVVDVFFFIWTSVQFSLVKTHLDEFLEYYHKKLLEVLQNHYCDISEFSYKKYLEEFRLEAYYEFPHSLQFALLLGIEWPFTGTETDAEIKERSKQFSVAFKEKIWFMVEECDRRGWIC